MSFSHKRKGSEMLVSPGPTVTGNHHNRGYQQQQPPSQQQQQHDSLSQTHHQQQQQTRHVVVVSPTNSKWQDVQAKIKDLYQRLVEEETKENSKNDHDHDDDYNDESCTDNVLLTIRNVVHEKHQVNQAFLMMEQEAARIQQAMNAQVEQAKMACQIESEQAHQMQKSVTELCAARDAIVAELEETLQSTHDVQAAIARHQQEATQQLDMHENETLCVKKKAARLQHQISLYASITGIKWDFDQETILAGHVAVPSQEAFRPFSIDPQQLSKFEVAHKLWNLMDGQDV